MGPEAWAWMAAWAVVLGGLVWLLVRDPHEHRTVDDAIDVLRARFARGDISQEEFERGRDALLADAKGRRT